MDAKTNVMRILEKSKINYIPHTYDCSIVNGKEVARLIGEDPNKVFKTLVTAGKTKKNYVFVIPVCCELNLKAAAAAASEKSIEMIPQKELLPLTGYIHGGCSPIGMKKPFPTFLHITAHKYGTIIFSAGKPGFQVEISPDDLGKAIHFTFADIISAEGGNEFELT